MSDESAESGLGEPVPDEIIEDSSTPPEETAADPEAKRPKGVQVRLNELTRLRHEAERDRDYWREFALKQQKEPTPAPEPPPVQGEPKVDDFENFADFTREQTKWVMRQEFAAQEERQRQSVQQQVAQERLTAFQVRAQTFAASMPDYREVAGNRSLPINDAMAEAIQSAERGPEVLYHLGKNPEEAARIASLTPFQAAMEIGRLEVRLSLPQPRKQSNAPEPVTNVLAGGATEPDVDLMSISADEYKKRWNRRRLEQTRK